MQAFAGRMGDLAPYAQQGVDQLRAQGSVPLTAWEVFDGADAVLAAAAGVVIGLFVLNAIGALSGRLDGAIVLTGLAATGLIAFRLIDPPGGNTPMTSNLLHAAPAAKVALAAAVLIVVGGVMSSTRGRVPAPAAAPSPAAMAAAHDIKVYDAS